MENIPLVTESTYHIFSKSIAGFKIFNNPLEFTRIQWSIKYFKSEDSKTKFSRYISDIKKESREGINNDLNHSLSYKEKLVNVIAYCIMSTHIHLVLRQLEQNGISIFVGNVLNSYTKYFNIKYKRKGPLWEGRFRRVLIKTDEQLLHLTRYIHLNPVTAYLTDKPEKWPFSSYNEYLNNVDNELKICNYGNIMYINPGIYKQFVEDNIDYQRKLASIKGVIFDQNSTP